MLFPTALEAVHSSLIPSLQPLLHLLFLLLLSDGTQLIPTDKASVFICSWSFFPLLFLLNLSNDSIESFKRFY